MTRTDVHRCSGLNIEQVKMNTISEKIFFTKYKYYHQYLTISFIPRWILLIRAGQSMSSVFCYLCTMKILMVCLGNICRSPLAEGILKHKAKEAGLNWTIDSAGTGNYNIGDAPHRLSQKVAKLNNIDICDHRAQLFTKTLMQQYDKIYVMDEQNYADVKRISGNFWDASKIDLLLNEAYPGEDREVDDPYYDNTEPGFVKTFNEISEACDVIIEKYGAKEMAN